MKSTIELLDAVKSEHGLASDYALAKFLGCVPSTIYGYRAGKSHLDDDQAMKVADALRIDRGIVLAWVAGERAKMPSARDAWRLLAQRLGGTAAVVLLALLVTEPLFEFTPYLLVEACNPLALCIMSNPHLGFIAVVFLILFNVLPFIPNQQQ